jgi:hypothetical protein
MKITVARKLLVAVAAIGLATVAHANSVAVFNTGVDGSGIPLADATVGDPHYVLVGLPGGTSTLAVRTLAGGFPIPPWVGDDALSAWIGPDSDTVLDGPIGNYDYQTTFDLTGLDPTTAVLAGQWAVDNAGLDILINGVSTGQFTTDGFNSLTPFSINGGFLAGVNTLDFIVNNQGGPTGLRAEISGDASPSPEPASLLMLGVGLIGLGSIRRRVTKSIRNRD